MQYQQTPQGLETLYNLPTAAQPQGLALLSQQQDADALTAQDNQRQFAYDTANDPMKLRKSGLESDTLAAQLPGHVALSNMHVRKDANEGVVNDAAIKDILGKYKSEDLKRHVADMENLGQVALQHYQGAYMNPFGAAARAKQSFVDAGHGDMWNDDWNDLPVGQLAAKLKDFGSGIQEHTNAFSKAMSVADAKANAALGVAGINADARVQAAEIAARAREAAAAAAKKQPNETMSAYEARIRKEAGQGSEAALAELGRLVADKERQAAASATVRTDAEPSIDSLGKGKLESNASVKATKPPPPVGTVVKGFRFKGGNPADKANWEQI